MTDQPTRVASLYDRYAASAAENYERHFVPAIGLPFARRLLDRAGLARGDRVLDVACGTGVATRLAAEAVGPEGAVAGLDANPGMLEVARAVSPDRIEWHEAPAEEIPCPDGHFDVVLCSMGLQFFPDRERALREVWRVLRPGGRVVLGTPGPTPPLFAAIEDALIEHVGPGASMFVRGVFSLHDPKEARELLEAAGFGRVEVEVGTVSLRLAPPASFFWQYVRSTPLSAVVAELDDADRAALEQAVVDRCQPFVDGESTVMEPGVLFAVGERPSEGDG